jgi:surface polysaccharide O-acyltransferase-like enzyme
MKKTYHIGADSIRIIATFAVIATHVVTDLVMNINTIGTGSWWFGNLLDTLCRPAVPLFIMLSGYLLLSPKEESISEFFKKRFIKIAFPFLIWCGIYYAWDWYWWGKDITWDYVFSSFVKAKVYTHLYFIPLILGLYAITPFLRKLIQTISQKQFVYLMIFFLALGLVLNFMNKWLPFGHTSFNTFTLFFPHIGYYLLGYYFRDKKFSFSQQKVLSTILIILTFITSLLAFWVIKTYWPHPRWHYFMIISVLIS